MCSILEKDTGLIVTTAQLIIWEDNNKVYFFEHNQFKLLFDFNLNTGDTLIYHVPSNYSFYNLVCGIESPDTSKTERAIIDSTQQTIINSQTLKTLYTSPLTFNDTNYLQWDIGQITERIGSSFGFLGFPLSQCLGGFPGHFRCYSDSLINYKPVNEDCDFVTGINKYSTDKLLTISPNPTSSTFTINGINTPYNLIIYNAVGQLLYQENNVKRTKDVDIPSFSKGLLFIRIESSGEVYYKKVIKQ